jgi:hypothetical protein
MVGKDRDGCFGSAHFVLLLDDETLDAKLYHGGPHSRDFDEIFGQWPCCVLRQ